MELDQEITIGRLVEGKKTASHTHRHTHRHVRTSSHDSINVLCILKKLKHFHSLLDFPWCRESAAEPPSAGPIAQQSGEGEFHRTPTPYKHIVLVSMVTQREAQGVTQQ